MGFEEANLAQVVEFRAQAAVKTQVREIKQIKLTAEGRLWPPGALGHRGDAAQMPR